MNVRTSLLALALVSAAACFAPTASADPTGQDQPATQEASQAREESREDHAQLREETREAGRAVRQDARAVRQAMHRTAHWRRYHVCKRYWHRHCVRWARRYRN